MRKYTIAKEEIEFSELSYNIKPMLRMWLVNVRFSDKDIRSILIKKNRKARNDFRQKDSPR